VKSRRGRQQKNELRIFCLRHLHPNNNSNRNLGFYAVDFQKKEKNSSEYVQQRETDLRMRFMELYPHSKIINQEYKQMQAKHASRRL